MRYLQRVLSAMAGATVLAIPALLAVSSDPASAVPTGNPPPALVVSMRNLGAGYCLDANKSHVFHYDNNHHAVAGTAQLWRCLGWRSDRYRQWKILRLDANIQDSPIEIQNVGSGDCLDSSGSNIGSGGPIILWACNTRDLFTVFNFAISHDSSGYLFQSRGAAATGANMCVDANRFNDGLGAQLQQYSCNNRDQYQTFALTSL